jgi:glycosyltransferase involved in cell wall biosynthesis
MHILLISHELDFSGAPIALLQLAKSLLRLNFYVSVASLNAGPLGMYFIESGAKQHIDSKKAEEYDLIITNTIVSLPAAIRYSEGSKKLVSWIHETEHHINYHGLSPKQFGFDSIKNAIFVANFQIRQFDQWMPITKKYKLNNCVTIPKNMTPYKSEIPYFVCSGPWGERKSQIRLIQLLVKLKFYPEIHFIGANKPNNIFGDKLVFPGSLVHEAALSRVAGSMGVISCSRDEAQPLIAIEAALMKIPIMLSDIPAHRELKTLIPDVVLFNPDEVESFAFALQALNDKLKDEKQLLKMQNDAFLAFNEVAFDRNVLKLINEISFFLRSD